MLILTILLPVVLGIITFILPKNANPLRSALAIAGTFIGLLVSFYILSNIYSGYNLVLQYSWIPWLGIEFALRGYVFSAFLLVFINLCGLLVFIYSLKHMGQTSCLQKYYTYMLITIGASCGAVLANDFILFLIFWGIVLLTLYGLLGVWSNKVALKSLFIIGFSDFCLLLGIILLWGVTHTFKMSAVSHMPLIGGTLCTAFVLMLIGAIAKSGAIPFHTWIPDAGEKMPAPVMAFIPAALDKLLGIYLLSRICLDFFELIPNSSLSLLLMFIGSFTIIAGVMMAIVQRNIMKMLSYSTISQAGYMILGIGTGLPIGIAGGLFHMVNNVVYKSCLFLCGGSAVKERNSAEIENLGGLSKVLPLTFFSCLIAVLSISGVPPFNGFFSKWMIYQSVIELGKSGVGLWVIWLIAAVFGSALTFAYFMKFLHGTFLGQSETEEYLIQNKKENFSIAFPVIILALICIIFGVFANKIPLKLFVYPTVGSVPSLFGSWVPTLATILILIGILIGVIIYFGSGIRNVRSSVAFIGGENINKMVEVRVTGGEFYNTVKNEVGLKKVYEGALSGKYDFYKWGQGVFGTIAHIVWILGDRIADYIWSTMYKVMVSLGGMLRKAHTGVLTSYLVWLFVGIVILLLIMVY